MRMLGPSDPTVPEHPAAANPATAVDTAVLILGYN
jgi:hypothetical protein